MRPHREYNTQTHSPFLNQDNIILIDIDAQANILLNNPTVQLPATHQQPFTNT